MVFGEIMISFHLDHDCSETETNCPACLKVNVLKNFFRILKILCVGFILIALLLYSAWKKFRYFSFFQYKLSPVVLKVRFNS